MRYFIKVLTAITLCVILACVSCKRSHPAVCGNLNERELTIIEKSDSVMYVLNVADKDDEKILRSACEDFSDEALKSPQFRRLVNNMLATVNAPEQGGVGIAAPQVGISHRVIVVCRVDKPGRPYNVYPNAHIDTLYGTINSGREGCLSIPSYRGIVTRYSDIVISYKDTSTLATVRDTVSGFAAVIFQHECDHLDGILYTDRADTAYFDFNWALEREQYDKQGKYDKPKWLRSVLSGQ